MQQIIFIYKGYHNECSYFWGLKYVCTVRQGRLLNEALVLIDENIKKNNERNKNIYYGFSNSS